MNRPLLHLTGLVAASALLLAACSSSAATPGASQVIPPAQSPSSSTPSASPSTHDLAGQWNGTWQNSVPDQSSGTFSLTWTQSGNTLTGTITIVGTPCLTGGNVTGTLNGSAISFGAVSGEVTVTYDGSISGNKMQGTYATTCGNARGSWQATKS